MDNKKYLDLSGLEYFTSKLEGSAETTAGLPSTNVPELADDIYKGTKALNKISEVKGRISKGDEVNVDVAGAAYKALKDAEESAKGMVDGLDSCVEVDRDNDEDKDESSILKGAYGLTKVYLSEGLLDDKEQRLFDKGGAALYVLNKINNTINNLDVDDKAVNNEYVSEVSLTDGKISVKREKLPEKVVYSSETTNYESKDTTNATTKYNYDDDAIIATSSIEDAILKGGNYSGKISLQKFVTPVGLNKALHDLTNKNKPAVTKRITSISQNDGLVSIEVSDMPTVSITAETATNPTDNTVAVVSKINDPTINDSGIYTGTYNIVNIPTAKGVKQIVSDSLNLEEVKVTEDTGKYTLKVSYDNQKLVYNTREFPNLIYSEDNTNHTEANDVSSDIVNAITYLEGAGNAKDFNKTNYRTTEVPSKKFVLDSIASALQSTLVYKGTVEKNADLPAEHTVGWVYVVKKAGTYAGKACEVGDYIICNTTGKTANDSHWDIINGENLVSQDEIKNEFTEFTTDQDKKKFATVDGTELKLKIIHHAPEYNKSTDTHLGPKEDITSGNSFNVPEITVDNKGHITSKYDRDVSLGNASLQIKAGLNIINTISANSNTDYILTVSNNDTPISVSVEDKTLTIAHAKPTNTFKGGATNVSNNHFSSISVDEYGHVTNILDKEVIFPDSITTIKLSNSNGTNSLTSNTTPVEVSESIITLAAANKWIVLAGKDNSLSIAHNTVDKVNGSYGSSAKLTLSFGGTFSIPYITVDNAGHITVAKSVDVTIPNNSFSVSKDNNIITIDSNSNKLNLSYNKLGKFNINYSDTDYTLNVDDVVFTTTNQTINGTKTFGNTNGTAPFIVNSNTMISHLNSELRAGLPLTATTGYFVTNNVDPNRGPGWYRIAVLKQTSYSFKLTIQQINWNIQLPSSCVLWIQSGPVGNLFKVTLLSGLDSLSVTKIREVIPRFSGDGTKAYTYASPVRYIDIYIKSNSGNTTNALSGIRYSLQLDDFTTNGNTNTLTGIASQVNYGRNYDILTNPSSEPTNYFVKLLNDVNSNYTLTYNEIKKVTDDIILSSLDSTNYNTIQCQEVNLYGDSKVKYADQLTNPSEALNSYVKQDGINGLEINRYAICDTADSTAEKKAIITSGDITLTAGTRVLVLFNNYNTHSNPTLNVGYYPNNDTTLDPVYTGAKQIWSQGKRLALSTNVDSWLGLSGLVDLVYDGTYWQVINNQSGWKIVKTYIDTPANTTNLWIRVARLYACYAAIVTISTQSWTNRFPVGGMYVIGNSIYSGYGVLNTKVTLLASPYTLSTLKAFRLSNIDESATSDSAYNKYLDILVNDSKADKWVVTIAYSTGSVNNTGFPLYVDAVETYEKDGQDVEIQTFVYNITSYNRIEAADKIVVAKNTDTSDHPIALLKGSSPSNVIYNSNVNANLSTGNVTGTTFTSTTTTKAPFIVNSSICVTNLNAHYASQLSNSRNITVGNVTKSFDGTADISFDGPSNFIKSGSTAASGLVPAPSTTAGKLKFLNESATWGVPLLDINFSKYITIDSDLNDYVTAGVYLTNGGYQGSVTTPTLKNCPFNNGAFVLYVFQYPNDTSCFQLALHKDGRIYQRYKTSGTDWVDWILQFSVKSTKTTSDIKCSILLNNGTNGTTNTALISDDITFNPSTKTLNVENINVTLINGVSPKLTDTTYESGSTNLLTTGTDNNNKVWSAKTLRDNTSTAVCSTAASTTAKTATCMGYVIKDPHYVHVTIINSNTAKKALTLNINDKGAKSIYINGKPSSSTNYTLPAGTYIVYYLNNIYYFNTTNIIPGIVENVPVKVAETTLQWYNSTTELEIATIGTTELTVKLPEQPNSQVVELTQVLNGKWFRIAQITGDFPFCAMLTFGGNWYTCPAPAGCCFINAVATGDRMMANISQIGKLCYHEVDGFNPPEYKVRIAKASGISHMMYIDIYVNNIPTNLTLNGATYPFAYFPYIFISSFSKFSDFSVITPTVPTTTPTLYREYTMQLDTYI